MSPDLLEAARLGLPDTLVSKVASSLGEADQNIRKAFKGAAPSILAGLLFRSSRNREESGIMEMLGSVANSEAIHSFQELLDAKKMSAYPSTTAVPAYGIHSLVPEWQKTIFGAKLINIINAISVYSEIKSSSASTVLNIATVATLAPIAQHAAENKLSFADIDSLLHNQETSILKAIPAGFNLTGSLGVDHPEDIGTKRLVPLPEPSEHHKNKTGPTIGRWVWPVLLLLTFGGLIWFFSKKDDAMTAASSDSPDSSSISGPVVMVNTFKAPPILGTWDSITGNFIYDRGSQIQLRLPDSTFIDVGENSTEARLFRMLSDSSWLIDTVDRSKNWVSFDRLYFHSGSAQLTEESKTQIANIATLLKNFPASSIKIGGYTDNTGDSITNKSISDQRAKAVSRELQIFGVASRQLTEAIGYGADHPVCTANDSPECRAQNRRVDLKVASK